MSNINVMRKNLGPVTAYKYAVQQGYTGTEQEFAALMASYATVAEEAEAAKDDAVDAKTAAEEAQAAAEAAAEQAEGAIEVDDTLSVEGRAADAKATGDAINESRKDFVELSVSDVQQGQWIINALPEIFSQPQRLCAKKLYPVYAGDKIAYKTGDLEISFKVFTTNDSSTAKSADSQDWTTTATEKEFTFETTGFLAIMFRHPNNATVLASEYDANVKVFQTVKYHANKGMISYQQTLNNKNGLDMISNGSVTTPLVMQAGKYINTSGVVTVNNNSQLAISGFVQIETYVSKIAYTHKAPLTNVMYSINFYDNEYTWLGGSNAVEISRNAFPEGTKYAVICEYDSTSAHNSCSITFYGFARIDDLQTNIDAVVASVDTDTSVINNDVFVDKTVIQSKNINYKTGNAETNNSFFACNYIAVEAETSYHVMRNNYKVHGTGNVAFYNANKTYISGQQSNWSDWTTPVGCAYVRFSVYIGSFTQETASFDGVIIVKGNKASAVNAVSIFRSSQYSPLYGKKWVGIGDSLTEVNARADLRYWDYIVQPYGMTFTNMGVGGTGYINRKNENKAFYQRALNMDTDADIITVFGGVNDCLFATADIGDPTDTGDTTWCGCVNTLIDNIRDKYLYAPLGIISPLPCDWVDSGNESNYDTQLPSDATCRMSIFVEKLKSICSLRGVPFLDLFHQSGLLPDDETFNVVYYSCGNARSGDGLHPNSNGHKLFYRKIEKFIETLLVE